jgi:hypothetical protein
MRQMQSQNKQMGTSKNLIFDIKKYSQVILAWTNFFQKAKFLEVAGI